MAIRIKFDNSYNAITPTLVLATRNGSKLGAIPATNINVSDNFNACFELSFSVSKYDNGEEYKYWDILSDLKLVWCREWDVWFEIYVEIREDDDTIKNVTAKSLGEAELSQIMLYDIEINTETDIDNDDYTRTVLYDEENPKGSLLNRIMEKAPHYSIGHVDERIAGIQRSFSFDNTSIHDAFNEIAEEIDCIFEYDSGTADDGSIKREINVYDLEAYCVSCGKRFEHTPNGVCPNCGSTNILPGYGDETPVYVSVENLAEEITYDTDTDSVKNCFRLEAGDDLMTATVRNSNPNGSSYLWYVPEEMRSDMSDELALKLSLYDDMYEYYRTQYEAEIDENVLAQYNALIQKYSIYTEDYSQITPPITGYTELMNTYYDTIDFYLYLHDSLMPTPEINQTTAATEAAKLTVANLSPVSVQSMSSISASSASNAVLSMAKAIVNPNFQVKVANSSYSNAVWTGNFTVTSYSDDEDVATSDIINVALNDNYENFVRQKIDKVLNSSTYVDDITSISALFKLSLSAFKDELKKYNLVSLQTFVDAAQSCVDILIEQGIADNETWANKEPNMYRDLYIPYYEKLVAAQEELKLREDEVSVIAGKYDASGGLLEEGIQTQLVSERKKIQNELDFEAFLGPDLWLEFAAYRREDTYSNSNYISDGLNNRELFERAAEFISIAQNEIFKSATLQHSISATLNNLLVMEEFKPIVDYFSVGNWIRICVDEKVYRLRLLSYSVDFENLENLNVTFSDVKEYRDGVTDSQKVMEQAASMATSYDHVSRQASKGEKSNKQLENWVSNGLALTKMKIVDNANNQNITWDEHGLLCREYLPVTDTYSDKQLKIINQGMYLTDDNWLTSKTGVGDFEFYNPVTGQMEEAYGVIAETLVGNLILGENVGVYNTTGSVMLNDEGISITADARYPGENNMHFTIQRRIFDENGDETIQQVAYFDADGRFVLSGNVTIHDEKSPDVNSIADLCDEGRYTQIVNSRLEEEEREVINPTIDSRVDEATALMEQNLNDYKTDVGQWLTFDESGLTLGAQNSTNKTVIDNQGMSFWTDGFKSAYINNSQLFIPHGVIEKTLKIGNFVFVPRENGSVALVWQEPEQQAAQEPGVGE